MLGLKSRAIEELFTKSRQFSNISALIFVERNGQKRIIIGERGDKIKLYLAKKQRMILENFVHIK